MTTKRKQILKALAFASCTTMDDLAMSTGLERKNMHDNVKASMREDLCERIRDDVTGQPAYKLTAKGRAWLENDKDNSSSVKPQPAAGENSGSQDKGARVAGSDMCVDPLPMGKADPAPPKPDDLPVAAGAEEIERIHNDYKFAMYMIRKALCIDHDDSVGIVPTIECLIESNNELRATVDQLYAAGPPIASLPTRYIVTDTYLMADSEEQASEIALELGKQIEIDTPVIVFHSHKARELRINWRDA